VDQMTTYIAVRTVGLRSYQQALLKAQLAAYPQIELSHLDDWGFGLLHADVLVIGVDTSSGQETLDMLRSFSGEKQPRVVTYSENDERMHLLLGRTPEVAERVKGHKQTGFYQRLQDALRKAGATGVVLEDVAGPAAAAKPRVEGPAAQSGIRWAD
jgi:hypothetical protein